MTQVGLNNASAGRKTIVVSAVNLVEAGTLAILRDCLAYLSVLAAEEDYRVVAIVFKKELAEFPHIEYIETQWPKKRWVNRLWYEYVSMKRISKALSPVYLWLSLHDTTPSVVAERRAVYCHNAYSFYKWKLNDWFFTPKIALFAIFTKYIYRTNIRKNKYLVVQQEWFRQAMSSMFGIDQQSIIVAPPNYPQRQVLIDRSFGSAPYSFIFAGSPNSHKNFECICEATDILAKQDSLPPFTVRITVSGEENNYARWLKKKWGSIPQLDFVGFLGRETLFEYYGSSNCLIFPSKVETWGLPISEFSDLHRPMLLADLPYTHETAAGSEQVAFFNPDSPTELATHMARLIQGDTSELTKVEPTDSAAPRAESWQQLFTILLHDENITDR
ncbi:glycosyltransferase family 4 protein [Sphingobacterium alkalisoli]|uniref:Glycosyltransferase family 4 protein n=1 Tax=Sphingobacterium alkalisoli TaxID=1874115 RepID=A0A4U0GRB1_9SPHI|nr:glycosyltransferase [Sphingobacterium alkalisoli]TJY60132.1 glycosyltransferase family 4 protein [Sphingobacterium alkalisoli]GGH32121.1 hypothetical protein GCM10011418_45430 [Sphingobacterium alkalisoli]